MGSFSSLQMFKSVATNDSLVSRIGLYMVILAAVTGLMDHYDLVYACPYCETQRAIIGLIGFFLMLRWSSLLGMFFTTIFGTIGIHVACAQIFLHIQQESPLLVMLHSINVHMALGTLILLFGSFFILLYRFYRQPE